MYFLPTWQAGLFSSACAGIPAKERIATKTATKRDLYAMHFIHPLLAIHRSPVGGALRCDAYFGNNHITAARFLNAAWLLIASRMFSFNAFWRKMPARLFNHKTAPHPPARKVLKRAH
jgi:hypothetical protein